MATYRIVKLCNLSPLHIGTGRDDYSTSSPCVHSDTLSAALAAMLAQTSVNADIESFMESFTISNAFPFVDNRYFMPKPIGRLAVQGCSEEQVRKKLKKLKYIELPVWSQVVSGEAPFINEKQLNGEFLLEAGNENVNPYRSQVSQRVNISPENSNTTPFFFKWQYHSPNAGLFCIVDASEGTMKKLEELFTLLGDIGIGSSKSVGGGKFNVKIESIELPTIENPDSTLLLSLYIPSPEEINSIDLEKSRYELLKRGGYMAGSTVPKFQHLLKKSVYMFNAGSVFAGQHRLNGIIADITPSWNDTLMHRVLRSGRPIVLPVKTQKV